MQDLLVTLMELNPAPVHRQPHHLGLGRKLVFSVNDVISNRLKAKPFFNLLILQDTAVTG